MHEDRRAPASSTAGAERKMRVLVTRPDPGGTRTSARLRQLGHDVVQMPLFETEVTATSADLPPTETICGLIATSARAFALFEVGDGTASDMLRLPVHVVGPATARAARSAGFSDVRESGGTAQDLASALVDDHAPPDADAGKRSVNAGPVRLVYLAGVPRTPVIEDALRNAGRPSDVVECYRMKEISYSTDILNSAILSPPPEAVLFYSANAARRFSTLLGAEGLGNALESAFLVCLSEAIAAELSEPSRARAVVAERPDEDSLLASLASLG